MDIRLFDADSPRAAELLRELHDEVLRPSFPPEEYVPATVIDPSQELAVIACSEDGRVLGGALGERYPASGVLLLGYLAVRPGLRGQGVGSAVMTALRERWLDGDGLALLELDDPRYHEPHPDRGDPVARLRFYGASGVRLLAMPYFQPRLSSDLPRAYHMFLGVIPPIGATLPPALEARRVSAFLTEYFEVCEGPAVHDDPELRALLAACGEDQIELVGTADFGELPREAGDGGPLSHPADH
jgi:GNAT superfamily N-acetyltransferase